MTTLTVRAECAGIVVYGTDEFDAVERLLDALLERPVVPPANRFPGAVTPRSAPNASLPQAGERGSARFGRGRRA